MLPIECAAPAPLVRADSSPRSRRLGAAIAAQRYCAQRRQCHDGDCWLCMKCSTTTVSSQRAHISLSDADRSARKQIATRHPVPPSTKALSRMSWGTFGCSQSSARAERAKSKFTRSSKKLENLRSSSSLAGMSTSNIAFLAESHFPASSSNCDRDTLGRTRIVTIRITSLKTVSRATWHLVLWIFVVLLQQTRRWRCSASPTRSFRPFNRRLTGWNWRCIRLFALITTPQLRHGP